MESTSLAPAPDGYTWSRTSPNPIEHVADRDRHHQPLCSTTLSARTQHIAGHASGRFPVCQRCQRIAAARWPR